jgi:hypothetical protein
VRLAIDILICVLVVDFLSGIFHWWEDTYLSTCSPAWLKRWIVAPNIEHHTTPQAMTRGTWLDRNRVLMFACWMIGLAIGAAGIADWRAYFVLVLGSQANEVHNWAHRRDVPRAVRWLQLAGILQSRRHHAFHHRSPYAARYCTVTNFLNPVLDGIRFWRALEAAIALFGARPLRATAARGGY